MLQNLPQVIEYPNPILREKSQEVPNVDSAVRQIAETMLEVMYASHGIGLAAVQIGILKKIIVIDIDKFVIQKFEAHKREHHGQGGGHSCKHEHELKLLHGGKPLILINPQIVSASDELFEYEEGCLSLPGLYGFIKRPAHIKLNYMDLEGHTQVLEASELLSVCIQHEIDHTEGKIFPDRASSLLKKQKMLDKYEKEHKKKQKKS